MTITKNGKEYLIFMEKIELLVEVSWKMGEKDWVLPKQKMGEPFQTYSDRLSKEESEWNGMRDKLDLWYDEMEELGHIGYPKDKFRGVEDL